MTRDLPTPDDLGQAAMETIMTSRLFFIDKDSVKAMAEGESDGIYLVWSANAREQIGEAIIDCLKGEMRCRR